MIQRWEYLCVSAHGRSLALYDFSPVAEANTLGEVGWELVGVTDTAMWFKRPVQP